MKVAKNIRKTKYGKFRFETEISPPISKTFDTLKEAEAFRDKILLERGVKPGARRVSDPDIGKYTGVEGQKHIKFNGKTYEVLIQRAGQDIKPKYFKTLKEATKARDNLVEKFPPQKQRGVVSDRVLKEARDKRKTRINTTAPLAATGTKKFSFHHIMPIGGEVPLTTNDIAVINSKMNVALSGFNRELNSIADGITNAYNKQPPDLKRVDQLNKAGESIVKKATKKLPKEYKNLIGFNKLQPIVDEYGTVINLSPERVGGVNQKTPGIKLENLTTQEASQLKDQIKTDALSLEKSTKQNKIFSGLKWNNDIGAIVETNNPDFAVKNVTEDLKLYAEENPIPVDIDTKPPKTSPTVLNTVGKTLAKVGAPLPTALIDSYFVGQQVKDGKSTAEIAQDPMNWIGLAAMEPLSKVSGIAESGKLNSALRLGLNPATIRGISRFAGLPGLAVSTAMTAYDQYKKYQNEEGFIYNLFNKEEK